MAVFRVCFLSSAGEVIGEKVFSAPRNFEAVQVATRMADGARCAGFEVWNTHRKIARRLRDLPKQREPQPGRIVKATRPRNHD